MLRTRSQANTFWEAFTGLLSRCSAFGFVPLHPAMNFDSYRNQLHEHLWILYPETQRSLGAFRPHLQNILSAHWCCLLVGCRAARLLKPECQKLHAYVRRKNTSRKNFPVFLWPLSLLVRGSILENDRKSWNLLFAMVRIGSRSQVPRFRQIPARSF